jgi:mannonate dehydratase
MDMYQVMKAMRAVDFDGVFIADHIPTMGNPPRIGTAYTIGYMKAMLERVNAEAKDSPP